MPPPVQTHDPRIVALPAAEIRRRFVEFFAERGHTVVPSASLVPAGDQTLLFTNSGMVQFKDVFDRCRDPLVHAGGRLPARPARRRQAQRLRGGRPDAPPPHVLRDARQLELRRLLQARGDPLGLGLPDPRPRHPGRPSGGHDLQGRRGGLDVWRDEIGLPPGAHGRWGDVDNGDDNNFWRMAETGPCGPCSEIHFDRGAEFSEGPHCIPDHSETCPRWLEIWNLVFMEFDQLPGRSRAVAVHERRHRDGPRAPGQRPPAGPDQLRHRPVHADPCPDARAPRPRPGRVRGRAVQLPGHRRPLAGRHVPHRRRRAAVERGPRLRPAPLFRRAVRHGRLLGRREPFLAETADGRHRRHGRGVPVPRDAARRDPAASSSGRRRSSRGPSMPGTRLLEAAIAKVAPERRARHRPSAGGRSPRMRRSSRATSPSSSTTRTASRST